MLAGAGKRGHCGAGSVKLGTAAAGVLVGLMMWTPFIARFITTRTVDRSWTAPFSLRRWGRPWLFVVGVPFLLPLVVYGLAFIAVGLPTGMTAWNPGDGAWDSTARIVLNVVFTLIVGSLFGVLVAMGEELGWRGYLQPRLDAAGVRHSVLIVIAIEIVWHAPVLGVVSDGWASYLQKMVLFAALKLVLTPLWTWTMYRAASVWPAILCHGFHNMVAQRLYPKLFGGAAAALWVGEFGVLPVALYSAATVVLVVSLRRRGLKLHELAAPAFERAGQK